MQILLYFHSLSLICIKEHFILDSSNFYWTVKKKSRFISLCHLFSCCHLFRWSSLQWPKEQGWNSVWGIFKKEDDIFLFSMQQKWTEVETIRALRTATHKHCCWTYTFAFFKKSFQELAFISGRITRDKSECLNSGYRCCPVILVFLQKFNFCEYTGMSLLASGYIQKSWNSNGSYKLKSKEMFNTLRQSWWSCAI